MHAFIAAIEYSLPEQTLTTENLSAMFPEWGVEKIDAKTGIHTRHIAGVNECASDLAERAVRKLFESGACLPLDIDFLILCTESPDYLLPPTACLLQERLGVSNQVGAFDFNLGCSGFVYGLGLAEGLVVSGQAHTIVLITADTYSKYLKETDRSSRTIFGDGAAATLIKAQERSSPSIGPFVYGTNGKGANHLIVRNSGTRGGLRNFDGVDEKQSLSMDGHRMFDFAVTTVPQTINLLLDKANLKQDQIDLFVFHQANAYILEELRRSLKIDKEKFQLAMRDSGNTTSSTIPIALKQAELKGRLQHDARIMLVGFGVGYSWGATILRWNAEHP